jgi:hypothetical protein
LDCNETAKTALLLGETIGFWIQTGAIILSAIGAIAIIYNNSHQAKKRATIDLVLHELSDKEIIEAKNHVRKYRESGSPFAELSGKAHDDNPLNGYLQTVLNHHEFVATGIKEGAFDEEIYKRMKRSLVLRDWQALEPYISEKRRQERRDKLFSEFQWLACRWKDNPITPEVSWWRRAINKIGL